MSATACFAGGVCLEACTGSCCVIKLVTRGMLWWGSCTAQGAAGISGYWLTSVRHVCARMPAVVLSRFVLCASVHCMYLRHPFLLLHVPCMCTPHLGEGGGEATAILDAGIQVPAILKACTQQCMLGLNRYRLWNAAYWCVILVHVARWPCCSSGVCGQGHWGSLRLLGNTACCCCCSCHCPIVVVVCARGQGPVRCRTRWVGCVLTASLKPPRVVGPRTVCFVSIPNPFLAVLEHLYIDDSFPLALGTELLPAEM